MYRQEVTSSNINTVGYDDVKQELEIEFKNGSIYTYKDVPVNIYQDLIDAESVGKAFHSLIIKGGFKFNKVV